MEPNPQPDPDAAPTGAQPWARPDPPPAGAEQPDPGRPTAPWASGAPLAPGQPAASQLVAVPGGSAEFDAPAGPRRPGPVRELLVGLGTLASVVLLGLPLGWLWQLITPRAVLVAADDGLYYTTPEPEQVFASDGVFILLGLGTGLLLALLSWILLRRYRGPVQLVALVVGSVGGAVLAAWFGHRFGLTGFRHFVDAAQPGTRASAPVALRAAGKFADGVPAAQGSVLAQAIAVVLTYGLLAGMSSEPSLRRRTVAAPQPEAPADPVAQGTYPVPETAGDGPAVSSDPVWRPDPAGPPAPPGPG